MSKTRCDSTADVLTAFREMSQGDDRPPAQIIDDLMPRLSLGRSLQAVLVREGLRSLADVLTAFREMSQGDDRVPFCGAGGRMTNSHTATIADWRALLDYAATQRRAFGRMEQGIPAIIALLEKHGDEGLVALSPKQQARAAALVREVAWVFRVRCEEVEVGESATTAGKIN